MMNFQSGTPFETVTLTTIGRERKLFFDIIEEGKQMISSNSLMLPRILCMFLFFKLVCYS